MPQIPACKNCTSSALSSALHSWAELCISCTHLGEPPDRKMGNDPRQRNDQREITRNQQTSAKTLSLTSHRPNAKGTKIPQSDQLGCKGTGNLTQGWGCWKWGRPFWRVTGSCVHNFNSGSKKMVGAVYKYMYQQRESIHILSHKEKQVTEPNAEYHLI